MQQTMFAFEDEGRRDPVLPLEAEERERLIELMAQAIEAVLRDAQAAEGDGNDRS
jgi:hypothetical protein